MDHPSIHRARRKTIRGRLFPQLGVLGIGAVGIPCQGVTICRGLLQFQNRVRSDNIMKGFGTPSFVNRCPPRHNKHRLLPSFITELYLYSKQRRSWGKLYGTMYDILAP